MEKFNADYSKRLPKEDGQSIISVGSRIGESEHTKDCFWSGYELNGNYYISLNDYPDCFWLVSKEECEEYVL